MLFDVVLPRIIFGRGSLQQVGPLCQQYAGGGCALVVTGKNVTRASPLFEILSQRHVNYCQFGVPNEPSIQDIEAAVDIARRSHVTFLIAIGGGSTLDTGKAVAGLLTNGGSPMDYVEVYGRGQKITKPAAPLICIPTTAGTGTEVTRNAVIFLPREKVKVSIRSEYLVPTVAIIDPMLTLPLPGPVTAYSGMDALTQCIEPYTCNAAMPMVDSLCLDGIRRAARSLKKAFRDPTDVAAREDMCWTSLYGGIGLANAKLGAVHGFAGAVGGMTGAPHGAICAALLPHVMRHNIAKLRSLYAQGTGVSQAQEYLRRYTNVACVLTGRPDAVPEDGVASVEELNGALAIPTLAALGVPRDDAQLTLLVQQSAKASSMKGNCVVFNSEELRAILDAGMGPAPTTAPVESK